MPWLSIVVPTYCRRGKGRTLDRERALLSNRDTPLMFPIVTELNLTIEQLQAKAAAQGLALA